MDRTLRELALKTATYFDGQSELHQRGGLKRASETPSLISLKFPRAVLGLRY